VTFYRGQGKKREGDDSFRFMSLSNLTGIFEINFFLSFFLSSAVTHSVPYTPTLNFTPPTLNHIMTAVNEEKVPKSVRIHEEAPEARKSQEVHEHVPQDDKVPKSVRIHEDVVSNHHESKTHPKTNEPHSRIVAIALDASPYSAYAFDWAFENIVKAESDQIILLSKFYLLLYKSLSLLNADSTRCSRANCDALHPSWLLY
jgi:hypothetical protein